MQRKTNNDNSSGTEHRHAGDIQGMNLTLYRLRQWIRSPRPYLMAIGFVLFVGFWYLSVEVW